MKVGRKGRGDKDNYAKMCCAHHTSRPSARKVAARAAFRARTRNDWRTFAPFRPRTVITTAGPPIYWHNFHELGEI